MSIIITVFMCTIVGGLVWITPEVVKIMAGKEYKEAIYVIPPVAINILEHCTSIL